MGLVTNDFIQFDMRWSKLLKASRQKKFGSAGRASVSTGISESEIEAIESVPSRAPLCMLAELVVAYEMPDRHKMELCMLRIKTN
jgi:hypothetical protein